MRLITIGIWLLSGANVVVWGANIHQRIKNWQRPKATPTRIIKDRADFPWYVRPYQDLKAIYIGACVEGVAIDRTKCVAHAHSFGPDKGVVCVLDETWFDEATVLHEVAHLVAARRWWNRFERSHGVAWQNAMEVVGGSRSEVELYVKEGWR